MSLLAFTQAVNLVVLAIALWLGLYVVTRSPRRLIAWLTGLTLWSIAGLSLNVLLTLNPPPQPAILPGWLRIILPFWQVGGVGRVVSAWLQGWSVTPTVMLWHHVTVLLRPRPLKRSLQVRVLVGYIVAVIVVLVQAYTPFLFVSTEGDPLYLNRLRAGPLYLLLATIAFYYTGLSLVNLVRSVQAAPTAMPRRQSITLVAATLAAGLTGPLSMAASALGWLVPVVTMSLLLGVAVVLVGNGVARHSALVGGRIVRHDFVYNFVALSLVTIVYLVVTWVSVLAYGVPVVAFVFVLMLAIVSHSLIDVAQQALDSLFYGHELRELRANLRQLARRAGRGQEELDQYLASALDSLCVSVRATFGLLVLFEEGRLRIASAYRWPRAHLSLALAALRADDVRLLKPGQYPAPLAEAALLIPLYAETEQLGVLLLGQPVNAISYSSSDLELLLDPSDRLADAIGDARRQADHLARMASLAETNVNLTAEGPGPPGISPKAVEDALRNSADYAHLGAQQLADLKLVKSRLPKGAVTTVERGQACRRVLVEALEKLRPGDGKPGEPPSREWHPYLILHEAYLEDVPNRDIMARLYISEGTFNRTRRAAVRAVARSLHEMEMAAVNS